MEAEKPRGLKRALKGWLRPWPIYLLAVAIVGGTVYMVRHREAGTADAILPPSLSLERNIEVQFHDVVMQGRDKGIQRWVITSPKVSLSADGRYTYFEPDPKGKFYNLKDWDAKEDEAATKMRSMKWEAKKATFDSFTEDLEIVGSAVITTDTEDVIKTEKVEYKSRRKEVLMPQHVDILGKDGTTITADSLKANTDAEVMELTGHVDLVTSVEDEGEKL